MIACTKYVIDKSLIGVKTAPFRLNHQFSDQFKLKFQTRPFSEKTDQFRLISRITPPFLNDEPKLMKKTDRVFKPLE